MIYLSQLPRFARWVGLVNGFSLLSFFPFLSFILPFFPQRPCRALLPCHSAIHQPLGLTGTPLPARAPARLVDARKTGGQPFFRPAVHTGVRTADLLAGGTALYQLSYPDDFLILLLAVLDIYALATVVLRDLLCCVLHTDVPPVLPAALPWAFGGHIGYGSVVTTAGLPCLGDERQCSTRARRRVGPAFSGTCTATLFYGTEC